MSRCRALTLVCFQAVAVKKMNKKNAEAQTLERMKREVAIMKMIRHENCIQFLNGMSSCQAIDLGLEDG